MQQDLEVLSTSDLGVLLIDGQRRTDMLEAEWLAWLGEFDLRAGWAFDGDASCVAWLGRHCGMARATAHDKLRVALALRTRPVVADAFADGSLSYSKVRALTRVTRCDDDGDRVLVKCARDLTVADTERLARHAQLLEEQETPPSEQHEYEQRGTRIVRRFGGMAVIETVVPVEDAERVMAVLDAELTRHKPVDESSVKTTVPTPTFTQRRADLLLDLIEAGASVLETGEEVDTERAMALVTLDYDTLIGEADHPAELSGGIPLSAEAARQLACDAGVVRIIVRGESEVVDVGRKTRDWNRAQRRAIRFRHHGHCCFPGCDLRITQIHHCNPWESGGETNLDVGVPLCRFHHHLVHIGKWTVSYNPATRTTTFTSPDNRTVVARDPSTLPLVA